MKKILPFCLSVYVGVCCFAQQNIAPQNLFVLTPQEQTLFIPPYISTYVWGTNYEDFPLKEFWLAFNNGVYPNPLGENAGPSGWYDPNGAGSQNHALLWMGESALGHALNGNVSNFETAATKCIILLDSLDFVQGHMRHEGIGGYISFWEGGIAAMALAGLYAPVGSTSGPELLKSARRWWADHIAVLRTCRMPDGQLALIGGRMNFGEAGDDDTENIRAAINLQIIDPQPHNTLHPYIAALITADGQPLHGLGGPYATHWDNPRHVGERWIVLRAFQSGALLRVPADHPTPFINRNVFKWTSGNKIHVATPASVGLPRNRFHVSWQAGQWMLIENADSVGTTGGKGLPNGHLPQIPFSIPANAVQILGPIMTTLNPSCSQNGNCTNDAAVMSIVKPYRNGCMTSINPQVVIKNEGTNAITELAIYYQVDNYSLYSDYAKGSVKSKRFIVTTGPGLLPDSSITLTLDASTVTIGPHSLKVWVMDVNKITDLNATNDMQTITFDVVNSGTAAMSYTEDFESTNAGDIPFGWTMYNPDASQNWFVYSNGSNKAIAFNNHAYAGAQNKKDELVMPVVDLTGNPSVYLSFDLCHASKPEPTMYDSLEVQISTDCGNTFTSIWGKGGTALNTVPANANIFIPSSMADYQNVQIDVSAYNSANNAIFKFINWSNNGNSTLIDNINFTNSSTTFVSENSENASLIVFPNPSTGIFTVTAGKNVNIEVYNSLGEKVFLSSSREGAGGGFFIDLSDRPSGIYNLVLSSGDGMVSSAKIVLMR